VHTKSRQVDRRDRTLYLDKIRHYLPDTRTATWDHRKLLLLLVWRYPFDYFMKKFETRVLLNRYLDEKVLGAAAGDYDKQNQYQAWFNTARVLSKVTIYDKELKRVSQNQSVGGGCGQSSGANCCSTKKS
jgi:hypothetical protein